MRGTIDSGGVGFCWMVHNGEVVKSVEGDGSWCVEGGQESEGVAEINDVIGLSTAYDVID